FINEAEIEYAKSRIQPYDDAFAFDLAERGRLKEGLFDPVRINTVPHKPWQVRERPVPMAHYEKLLEFLREKLAKGVMEPSIGAYASPWFVVAKKDG
ncbi:hypothetical protein BCR33DRAFT_638812, partial [Rhizoclosmatium globosum]